MNPATRTSILLVFVMTGPALADGLGDEVIHVCPWGSSPHSPEGAAPDEFECVCWAGWTKDAEGGECSPESSDDGGDEDPRVPSPIDPGGSGGSGGKEPPSECDPKTCGKELNRCEADEDHRQTVCENDFEDFAAEQCGGESSFGIFPNGETFPDGAWCVEGDHTMKSGYFDEIPIGFPPSWFDACDMLCIDAYMDGNTGGGALSMTFGLSGGVGISGPSLGIGGSVTIVPDSSVEGFVDLCVKIREMGRAQCADEFLECRREQRCACEEKPDPRDECDADSGGSAR